MNIQLSLWLILFDLKRTLNLNLPTNGQAVIFLNIIARMFWIKQLGNCANLSIILSLHVYKTLSFIVAAFWNSFHEEKNRRQISKWLPRGQKSIIQSIQRTRAQCSVFDQFRCHGQVCCSKNMFVSSILKVAKQCKANTSRVQSPMQDMILFNESLTKRVQR